MKSGYDYILFDWDGCLAHSLPIWLKSFMIAFERRQIVITERQVIDAGIYHFEEVVKYGVVDMERFGEEVYEIFNDHLADVRLHHEAIIILTKLKEKGKKIAVVTSSLRDVFEKQITTHDCRKYFDTVITNEDVTHHKPHAEPIRKAMKILGATKEKTMMIGDSDMDILGAKNAGVTSVWYHPIDNYLFFPVDHFAHLKPDHTIRSFSELLAIV